jgi:hypothetical protein
MAHKRHEPGFMVPKQVVLWSQRRDKCQAIVQVSLGIYGSVVTVSSDSAATQARHVDGIAKMQHRVWFPSVTETEHFLEYSLVCHEAVTARYRKEAFPLPCYVRHELFALGSSSFLRSLTLDAVRDSDGLLLWLTRADLALEVFGESFLGCGFL